jgi:hypothetical protein
MNNDKINLQFSVEEVNLIIKALGTMPFNQVYEIIGNIHQQANQQLFGIEPGHEGHDFQLKKDK